MTKDELIEALEGIIITKTKNPCEKAVLELALETVSLAPDVEALRTVPKDIARPLPCVTCDGKPLTMWKVKEHFAKIDEELNELKEIVYKVFNGNETGYGIYSEYFPMTTAGRSIAEEAADTITVITSMLEVMGIDAAQRAEAQRRVNEKNRSRGRL